MAILEDKQAPLRRFGLPTAAGALGAGAGLLLTRKRKMSGSMPKLGDLGLGDLADDLRGRVEAVLQKAEPTARMKSAFDSGGGRHLDANELGRRRREREQRRSRRRARS
jgi:hypothetical protein